MTEAAQQTPLTSRSRQPLTEAEAGTIDRYWRAANYVTVGQIYLMANPLLAEPLRPEHIKPRLLGHWGTSPGLNFIWAHLSRAIKVHDQPMMYVIGPGHGGPAALAGNWLDGTYSEVYPSVSQDAAGLRELFRQFSFPGGVPSHVSPETPGSIHEGGELGYSLSHAHGAAFDNPGLIVACIVGDGEAETGPLATSWHAHRFLNPARDGAVLPILHLNGWKIANPAVLARIPDDELDALLRGYGYEPRYVTGHDASVLHQDMAAVLDESIDQIRAIHDLARADASQPRPRWPMIVLRTPKGWTGPPWSTACRSRAPGGRTRCRWPRSGPTRSTWPSWSSGCGPTGRMSCSTRAAGHGRSCSASFRTVTAGSAPARTPTAGSCCAT